MQPSYLVQKLTLRSEAKTTVQADFTTNTILPIPPTTAKTTFN